MTIHECKEYGAGPCLNENLIGEIAEANATLANRIAQLEAENAALKAELTDTKRKTATLRETNRALMDRAHRRKAQVNKMQRERDALRGDVRKSDYVVALDFRIVALKQENAALKQRNAELVDGLSSYWAECGAVEAVKLPSLESRLLAENAALKTERDVWAARWSRMCYACDDEVGRRARANNRIIKLKNEVAARLQDVAADRATNAALAERVQALEAALDAKTDEAATLRAVIEQVTWEHNCPWCGESHGKHSPDCPRQSALAQTAQTSEVKA